MDIYDDKERFTQIIHGLLHRSIEFLREGEIISITAKTKKSKNINNLVISMEDQGFGLSETQRKELFNTHNPVSIDRDIEGIDISLESIEALIILHKGTIKLEDNYSNGSKVTLTIPYISAEENKKIENFNKSNVVDLFYKKSTK